MNKNSMSVECGHITHVSAMPTTKKARTAKNKTSTMVVTMKTFATFASYQEDIIGLVSGFIDTK